MPLDFKDDRKHLLPFRHQVSLPNALAPSVLNQLAFQLNGEIKGHLEEQSLNTAMEF